MGRRWGETPSLGRPERSRGRRGETPTPLGRPISGRGEARRGVAWGGGRWGLGTEPATGGGLETGKPLMEAKRTSKSLVEEKYLNLFIQEMY